MKQQQYEIPTSIKIKCSKCGIKKRPWQVAYPRRDTPTSKLTYGGWGVTPKDSEMWSNGHYVEQEPICMDCWKHNKGVFKK